MTDKSKCNYCSCEILDGQNFDLINHHDEDSNTGAYAVVNNNKLEFEVDVNAKTVLLSSDLLNYCPICGRELTSFEDSLKTP